MTVAVRALLALLDDHVACHPELRPRDLYKAVYQGVLGPEHLVATPEAFAEALRVEHAAAVPAPDEPLFEPLRPDGRLHRVNLRPFKARGGDIDALADACLRAARDWWGTPDELRAAWTIVDAACRQRRWPIPADEALTPWLEAHGYPAVHHSDAYRAAYRPSYRLVGLDGLRGLM